MNEIATFSIFKFDDFKSKFWALSQMQFAHQTLKSTKNQSFYKLMGSGKQGFQPWADFSTFALFQVWNSIEAAEDFQQTSSLFLKYQKRQPKSKLTFYNRSQFAVSGIRNQFSSQFYRKSLKQMKPLSL